VPDPAFVSFHADRPAGAAGAHPNANLDADSYRRMLDLLFRSVRLTHPDAPCVLLTDAGTRLDGVAGSVQRLDGPVDHAALMLSRTLAQAAFVERSDFARPLVLLDSDILRRPRLTAADHAYGARPSRRARQWRKRPGKPGSPLRCHEDFMAARRWTGGCGTSTPVGAT